MGREVSQMKIQGQGANDLASTCEKFSSLPDGKVFSALSVVVPEIEHLAHGNFSPEQEGELKQAIEFATDDLAQVSFPVSGLQQSEHAVRFPGALDVEVQTDRFKARFSGYSFGIRTGIYFDFRPANIDEALIPLEIVADRNPVTGTYSTEFSEEPSAPYGVVLLVEQEVERDA